MKPQNESKEKIWIVYLSTYPPRECGIATFSDDLINYGDELFAGQIETRVVAMNILPNLNINYSSKVILQISQNVEENYIQAAQKLNELEQVKIVSIQHEFGIFGENYGEKLILFLEKLEKPVSITFHTVLPDPDPEMKRVTEKIIARAERLVVMTELSRKLLIEVYKAPREKIHVIPHGIHPQLYTDTLSAKKKLNMEGKSVLATFGLLSRGKGIEYAIAALPGIIKKYPNVVYLILGATHPIVLKNEGEEYRNFLEAEAARLGVSDHVIFQNKYLSKKELFMFLEATDIYVSPPQNPNQAVSGTLSYALGEGRPVISTRFMQAREIITDEVGALVDFNNSAQIEDKALNMLSNPARLEEMGKAAYFHTRNMIWPNVALSYMTMYSSMLPESLGINKCMLPIKIDHIQKLTDDFGILQFAPFSRPDPTLGYTVDDNARALVALLWYNEITPASDYEKLIKIYTNFIEKAVRENGEFINYFDMDKKPHPEFNNTTNLEDAGARAMWALAVASTREKAPESVKKDAEKIFKKQFSEHRVVQSPRAAAFYIKSFAEYLSKNNDAKILDHLKTYADFLVDLFQRSSSKDWLWFEESMTYSNGLLPEALLAAYSATGNPEYFEIAKISLDFLIRQSFEGDICVPVGQAGWFKKDGKKERYDQQPEEVSALVLALVRMYEITKNNTYHKKMQLAFDWFLGNNLSHQVVYTHTEGGCYDGVSEAGINLNQGAESTISYLLARLAMEKAS